MKYHLFRTLQAAGGFSIIW